MAIFTHHHHCTFIKPSSFVKYYYANMYTETSKILFIQRSNEKKNLHSFIVLLVCAWYVEKKSNSNMINITFKWHTQKKN